MKWYKAILAALGLVAGVTACGQTADGYRTVSPEEFGKMVAERPAQPEAVLLDVRTPQEYAEGHLDGAVNLDWLNPEAFEAGAAQLPEGATLYVYCRSGGRSAKASRWLAARGFQVVNLAGGYRDVAP